MYGAGVPVLLFFILSVWGLKDEELTWQQCGAALLVLLVSFAVIHFTGSHYALIALPAVVIDVWLLAKLDILGARVR